MRLIDSDKLLEYLNKYTVGDMVQKIISEQPTIDVVFCPECIYNTTCIVCTDGINNVFCCSGGKRKKNNE